MATTTISYIPVTQISTPSLPVCTRPLLPRPCLEGSVLQRGAVRACLHLREIRSASVSSWLRRSLIARVMVFTTTASFSRNTHALPHFTQYTPLSSLQLGAKLRGAGAYLMLYLSVIHAAQLCILFLYASSPFRCRCSMHIYLPRPVRSKWCCICISLVWWTDSILFPKRLISTFLLYFVI